jgi:uncharacterized phage protein (TIGR02220 family)
MRLPYFKFSVTKWLTGSISTESIEVQGLFIAICSLYWMKKQNGEELTETEIKHRFKIDENNTIQANAWRTLSLRYVSLDVASISIAFLDEQLNYFEKKREINKKNGQKGGLVTKSKSKNKKRSLSDGSAMAKPSDSVGAALGQPIKDKDIILNSIISFLNSTCGTGFKTSSEKTKKHIFARLNEGFTEEDFKAVIKSKGAEWGKDPKMQEYLRPETLFGTKFEGYLQAAKKVKGAIVTSAFTASNSDLTRAAYPGGFVYTDRLNTRQQQAMINLMHECWDQKGTEWQKKANPEDLRIWKEELGEPTLISTEIKAFKKQLNIED